MNSFVKRIALNFLGQEVCSVLSRWRAYRKNYKTGRFGRSGIDEKLERLMPHKNGFYVELGANDGALSSNSYYFELKKGWTGILIEPAPNLFLSCSKRRKSKNQIFCNACVPFDYKNQFVRMRYSDSMTISDDLNLDIDDHDEFIESGAEHLMPDESTFVFGAKSATLNSILIEASAPELIDFLSLDVEGAELDVLRGIDFKKFRFKHMVIESRKIDTLVDYLKPHDYKLVEKIGHIDYLFSFGVEDK